MEDKPKRQPFPAKAKKKKNLWMPPGMKTGKLFESNSLACGKNSPTTDECLQNPTRS